MSSDSRRLSLPVWFLLLALVLVALLPWWRNREYLRDLYDYGLVLAANGHLDGGERPYLDFTTPIQAGFLGLNWLVERAGGGTYAGLTRGGAALIVLSGMVLTLMLARRWPWWQAAVVGWAITVAGASQHTILWHNALGLFCLAVASWAAAVAPVLRRDTWPWHVMAFAGLFFGGLNKLNLQMVAVTVALAWPIRAGLLGRAGLSRVLLTLLAVLIAGAVLPVAAELAWTGAKPGQWFANVVQLAAGSRMAALRRVLTGELLFHPIHDYYGALLVPQVGLVGVAISLLVLAGCWPAMRAERADRWLLPVAASGVAAAGAALLATNFEIACLGLGAWLAMAVSMWLGFAPPPQRGIPAGGLFLMALLVGVTSWWAAWQGLRSQFGYSGSPRSAYVAADTLHPAYARLAGLRVPPEFAASLRLLPLMLPDPGPDRRYPVFYAAGLEFADRFFPGIKEPGHSLLMQWGSTYSAAGQARFAQRLALEGHYQAVLCTVAFDYWPEPMQTLLQRYYERDLIGPVFRQWKRREERVVKLSDSLMCAGELGGNLDSRMLYTSSYPLSTRRMQDGRCILGTTRLIGEVLVSAKVNRLSGVVVLDRLPGAGAGPLFADVKFIVHGATPEDVRWAKRVELPAGRQAVTVPFAAEAAGRPLQLWIGQPEQQEGRLLTGVRELAVNPAAERAGEAAPRLGEGILPESPDAASLAASLFGPVAWRPQRLVVRGGRPGAAGLALPARGEAWFGTPAMTGEIAGELSVAEDGRAASVWVVWYQGGRLEILGQYLAVPGQAVEFRALPLAPGGWIGVVVGETEGAVSVRVTAATFEP